MPSNQNDQIAIIGGGTIGLSIGWQLARNGKAVTIFDRDQAGQATSHLAAGMLAPVAEAGFEEVELMQLGQESLQWYPEFIEELKKDTDLAPDIERCGTLLAALGRDDNQQMRRLHQFRKELNLEVEWLTGTEAREKEPLLSPRIPAAMWFPGDAQIDNHRLLEALIAAFKTNGGQLLEQRNVNSIAKANANSFQINTTEGAHHFSQVVLASGSWIPKIDVEASIHIPIRPVKGQILVLNQITEFKLSSMVRFLRGYLVPKDSVICVGATTEEKGFNTQPTAGGIKNILEEAWETIPAIFDLPIEKVEAGLRPATPDNAPIIGETSVENLFCACGHYRHGILLTPITAFGLANEILEGNKWTALENFGPARFEDQT